MYQRSFSTKANLSPFELGFCIARIWAAATSLTSTYPNISGTATGILPLATIAIALFDSPISPDIDAPMTSAGLITARSNGLSSFLINSHAAFSAKVLLFE